MWLAACQHTVSRDGFRYVLTVSPSQHRPSATARTRFPAGHERQHCPIPVGQRLRIAAPAAWSPSGTSSSTTATEPATWSRGTICSPVPLPARSGHASVRSLEHYTAAAGQGRHHRPPRQGSQVNRQGRRRPRAAHPGLLRHGRRAHPPCHHAGTGRVTWPGPAGRARGRRLFCPSPDARHRRPSGAGAPLIDPARPGANPPHATPGRQHVGDKRRDECSQRACPAGGPAVGPPQPHNARPAAA
jgi:hypothetical protein